MLPRGQDACWNRRQVAVETVGVENWFTRNCQFPKEGFSIWLENRRQQGKRQRRVQEALNRNNNYLNVFLLQFCQLQCQFFYLNAKYFIYQTIYYIHINRCDSFLYNFIVLL